MKIHLDTDIGGDIDDLAALALLLRWPGVELTGITTVADEGGRRAGYARATLALAGRDEVPVAAGADVAGHDYRWRPGYPPEDAFWPAPVSPAPGPLHAALELLHASVTQGARVIGIGPCTNLAHYEARHPGLLRAAGLTLVGGWVRPPRSERSVWGNELDYNLQMDVAAARQVLARCAPTLVPLHVTVETTLRHAWLPALAAAGPLGALLARQAAAYDAAGEFATTDRAARTELPADFINHLYDALGCAVALGWPGVSVQTLPLRIDMEDGWLVERHADDGIPTRVVADVDGTAFDRLWLRVVTTGTIEGEEETR